MIREGSPCHRPVCPLARALVVSYYVMTCCVFLGRVHLRERHVQRRGPRGARPPGQSPHRQSTLILRHTPKRKNFIKTPLLRMACTVCVERMDHLRARTQGLDKDEQTVAEWLMGNVFMGRVCIVQGVETIALRCAGYNNVDLAKALGLGMTVRRNTYTHTKAKCYMPFSSHHRVGLFSNSRCVCRRCVGGAGDARACLLALCRGRACHCTHPRAQPEDLQGASTL